MKLKALALPINAAILSLAFSHSALTDDHHQQAPSFTVSEIKNNSYFLQGKGGNILAMKGDDGLLLVDSDYSDMTPALQAALKQLNSPLKYVLNTHYHGDHTQGNLSLGKQATIVAHDNVYHRLSQKHEIKLFNMSSEAYPKHALPSITFAQTLTMHFNGETVKALHAPNGHTDGDSVIFFSQADIVHMGDHFFNGFFPFIDVAAGGRVRGMAKNIDTLLPQISEQTTIVPGHGPLAKKAELIAFRDMLLASANEVETMIKAGKSLEQIQAQGLDKKWQSWTKGFLNEATWIAIVHSSLKASEQ